MTEQPAREMVGDYLRMHGFSVSLCDGGAALRKAIAQQVPDLIVLDLNMPEEDGPSIIRDLKQRTSVPIIMLTATASAIDEVVGLELGADDYLAKPCELRGAPGPGSFGPAPQRRRSAAGGPARRRSAAAPPRERARVRFGTKWLGPRDPGVARRSGQRTSPDGFGIRLVEGVRRQSQAGAVPDRLLELANARDARGIRPGHRPAYHGAIRREDRAWTPPTPSVIRTVQGGGYLFSPGGETSSLD